MLTLRTIAAGLIIAYKQNHKTFSIGLVSIFRRFFTYKRSWITFLLISCYFFIIFISPSRHNSFSFLSYFYLPLVILLSHHTHAHLGCCRLTDVNLIKFVALSCIELHDHVLSSRLFFSVILLKHPHEFFFCSYIFIYSFEK